MKKILLAFVTLAISNTLLAQIKSVENLKGVQDTRKQYIDPSKDDIIKAPSKSTFVDPFIGTGGHGHTFPGATSPFGMLQLSPDTRMEGWDACSGYHYSDSIIYGFSHTHLSGTGVADYCDLLLVPQQGKVKLKAATGTKDGYGSHFTHSKEKASPGYYEVDLLDQNIHVRLTSDVHSGMHEYTFQHSKGKKYLLLDLDHRDQVLGASATIVNNTTVSGSRISASWASEQHFYFQLETNIPFSKSKKVFKKGKHLLLLQFPENTRTLLVKVGISAVDEKGAAANLKTEIPDWDFNALRAKTVRSWNNELNKINFYAGDPEIMKTFYTALYHSFICPNTFSDVDGRYRGMDGKIHQLTNLEDKQYSVFSLWDTYRATHPLFTLTQPEKTNAFIRTFLRQYDESGDLPLWELAGNETECMIGYHSASVISDAFIKGYADFDIQKALNAMVSTSNKNELGKHDFATNGYISLSNEPESVSKALEYAYDDFCIRQFAVLAGKTETAEKYLQRSLNFINHYDPSTKFMRARREGLWFSPFDPAEVNFNYTEANSWQYSLYAPHAVGVITDLLGGKKELENWLHQLFTTKTQLSGRDQVDITGLIGQYAHGNEPSHHMAYLYNYTDQPHFTQFYLDTILKEMYNTQPNGLSGNEDCGQMSSWYVMNAMGLYQIAPGNPYYEFGRPLGEESILPLENGKQFRIRSLNNSANNKYIQKIRLNGLELNRLYIGHDEIMKGGMLEFDMGPTPSKTVDSFLHAPTLSEIPNSFTPVPYFENENRTFIDSMDIQINFVHLQNVVFEIHYTLDGTEPQQNSPIYSKPLSISTSTLIKAALFNLATRKMGTTVSNEFIKRDRNMHLTLSSTYATQYSASGKDALIDGLQGGSEYRSGDWQGFNGSDIVAEISFDTPRSVEEIGLNCLQNKNAWIFFPQSVSFEISIDGIHYENAFAVQAPTEKFQKETEIYEYTLQLTTKDPIRKIRVKAVNFGACPKGHLGEGNPTWLFADELFIR